MARTITLCFLAIISATLLLSCEQKPQRPAPPSEAEIKVVTIEPTDAPVAYEFVGQAASSRQVEIRARVDGFLDKIAYKEGEMVEAGQILFELDKKPFLANLQQAKGELALQQARLATAAANLNRIKPLAEKDAVSKKDLDDAVGRDKESKAAVLSAQGAVRETQLKLSYATIRSPLKGLASKADKQEGSYIPTGPDSLLTYVAQLDPIWVNFSVSENQTLAFRNDVNAGRVTPPENLAYEVEVVLGDGSIHPHRGVIDFAEPNLDPTTGTFMLRAELANPKGDIRPGQFVRVRLHGAKRKNAILLPQSAVLQGSKGHFVWVVDKNGQAAIRSVDVGPWQGDNWFIQSGLNKGDRVAVDGIVRLRPGMPVKILSEI